jgi:hypothetical protein
MSERHLTLKRESAPAQGARAKATRFESAESALEREQAQADAQNPDWDLASRITTAQGALERGVPPEVVRKTYGDKVFAAATAERNKRELAHASS